MKGEIVHHINGNKQDNSDQNLMLLNPEQHYQLHIAPLLEARKEAQITEKLTQKIEAQTIEILITGFAILGTTLFILGLISKISLQIWYMGLVFLVATLFAWFLKRRSQ